VRAVGRITGGVIHFVCSFRARQQSSIFRESNLRPINASSRKTKKKPVKSIFPWKNKTNVLFFGKEDIFERSEETKKNTLKIWRRYFWRKRRSDCEGLVFTYDE